LASKPMASKRMPRRSPQPWYRWHGATPASRTRTTSATRCSCRSRACAH